MRTRDLERHLVETYGVSERDVNHILEEFLAFYDQTLEEFVCRRHQDLQKAGMKNSEIFQRIQHEASARRFAVRRLSERQIRRLVYG